MGSKVQTRAEEVERNYKESTIYIHEFDTELEPSFTGAFRVNGTLYSFSNETPTAASWATIKTAGVDTQVYVKAVPSGDSCTLEYTTTAPTFDTEKLGWYSPTVGQENHRYITDSCEQGYLQFGAYLDTTDLYVYKHIKGSGRNDRNIILNNSFVGDSLYKLKLGYNFVAGDMIRIADGNAYLDPVSGSYEFVFAQSHFIFENSTQIRIKYIYKSDSAVDAFLRTSDYSFLTSSKGGVNRLRVLFGGLDITDINIVGTIYIVVER